MGIHDQDDVGGRTASTFVLRQANDDRYTPDRQHLAGGGYRTTPNVKKRVSAASRTAINAYVKDRGGYIGG